MNKHLFYLFTIETPLHPNFLAFKLHIGLSFIVRTLRFTIYHTTYKIKTLYYSSPYSTLVLLKARKSHF